MLALVKRLPSYLKINSIKKQWRPLLYGRHSYLNIPTSELSVHVAVIIRGFGILNGSFVFEVAI